MKSFHNKRQKLPRRKIVKCSTCKDVNLGISDRQYIEIDYCLDCHGIWLDRA
ncbi:MAG: zf-TFIIB domain-containing protein [Pseudomonadota bacterium]